jgi:hypothetical protein
VRAILTALLLLVVPAAVAQGPPPADDEAAIRRVIATWYAELQKGEARRHWQLFAPGALDGGPAETELNPHSRARSPTISNELAARALRFAYEIDVLKIDPRLAKAIVWEKGYFYAWAAQRTYETAASALFVLEKQPDGDWLILAHEAQSIGIPPNKVTNPMPDLRDLFYATHGKDRDPEADARNAGKF